MIRGTSTIALLATAIIANLASAQTFQRLGGCPTLGCVFPPDQVDFLAGQYFDIRLEIHAPVNGSEANGGVPDEKFSFTIAKKGAVAVPAATYFKVSEPVLEKWNFTWFEGQYNTHSAFASHIELMRSLHRFLREGCWEAFSRPGHFESLPTGGLVRARRVPRHTQLQ